MSPSTKFNYRKKFNPGKSFVICISNEKIVLKFLFPSPLDKINYDDDDNDWITDQRFPSWVLFIFSIVVVDEFMDQRIFFVFPLSCLIAHNFNVSDKIVKNKKQKRKRECPMEWPQWIAHASFPKMDICLDFFSCQLFFFSPLWCVPFVENRFGVSECSREQQKRF